MIKQIYFLFAFLLAGNMLIAQSVPSDSLFTFIVHGKVYNDSTGAPLANHEVKINDDEQYLKIALTDLDGFYADTITGLTDPNAIIHVSTRDCKDVAHSQSVLAGNLQAIINFAICGDVPVPVFHMGGLVYAGNFPLNNPQSTGDTGVAYLYRSTNLGLMPVDTNHFTQYGYYLFLNMVPGDYLVRVKLTPGSTHFHDYFPSYAGNEIRWKTGRLIHIGDSNVYFADIHLVTRPGTAAGSGNINGYVVAATKTGNETTIPFGDVQLYDQNYIPLDYTMTLADGTFSFETIPMGTYLLYIEVPGMYSKFTTIVLSDQSPNANEVRIELFPRDVTGITDPGNTGQETGMIYPNPATDKISIDCNFHQNERIQWTIYSVGGQKVSAGEYVYMQGSSLLTIPTQSLTAGLYFLMIVKEDGTMLAKKFSKR